MTAKFRIDQTGKVFKYSKNNDSYLFYGRIDQMTELETIAIEEQIKRDRDFAVYIESCNQLERGIEYA